MMRYIKKFAWIIILFVVWYFLIIPYFDSLVEKDREEDLRECLEREWIEDKGWCYEKFGK